MGVLLLGDKRNEEQAKRRQAADDGMPDDPFFSDPERVAWRREISLAKRR